jgi:hypothetical protein
MKKLFLIFVLLLAVSAAAEEKVWINSESSTDIMIGGFVGKFKVVELNDTACKVDVDDDVEWIAKNEQETMGNFNVVVTDIFTLHSGLNMFIQLVIKKQR